MPPEDGNDSDKDDGGSDDEGCGNVRDLGKWVLSVPAEVRIISHGEVKELSLPDIQGLNEIISGPNEEISQIETSQENNRRENRKNKERKWSEISFSNSTIKSVSNKNKMSGKIEIDIANIAPIDMFKYIWDETIITSRRMYWETIPDSHNNLVSSSMTRNKFKTIHRFLHFNDNR